MCVSTQIAEMLLELCVTELEDVASDSEYGRATAHPVIQESSHPYTDDTSITGHVKIPGQSQVLSLDIFGYNIFFHPSLNL